MREVRADIGIALDGDADRCLLVDEKGEIVDGDVMLAFCARDLLERGAAARREGRRHGDEQPRPREVRSRRWASASLRTQVGDRYVVEAMRAGGYNLGGEQSGHIIFLDHNTTATA